MMAFINFCMSCTTDQALVISNPDHEVHMAIAHRRTLKRLGEQLSDFVKTESVIET